LEILFEPKPYKKIARKQILLLTQNYLDSSKNFLASGTDTDKDAVLDKWTIPPTNLFFFRFSDREKQRNIENHHQKNSLGLV